MICELLELLKKIEWEGPGDFTTCPECKRQKYDEPEGIHDPGCALSNAIQNLELGKWRVYYGD